MVEAALSDEEASATEAVSAKSKPEYVKEEAITLQIFAWQLCPSAVYAGTAILESSLATGEGARPRVCAVCFARKDAGDMSA